MLQAYVAYIQHLPSLFSRPPIVHRRPAAHSSNQKCSIFCWIWAIPDFKSSPCKSCWGVSQVLQRRYPPARTCSLYLPIILNCPETFAWQQRHCQPGASPGSWPHLYPDCCRFLRGDYVRSRCSGRSSTYQNLQYDVRSYDVSNYNTNYKEVRTYSEVSNYNTNCNKVRNYNAKVQYIVN